jgi:hypothetical protein
VSFISILFPDTGDMLRIADPKTVAGQAAWQRATDESIELTRNPGEMAGERLLAIVGQRSSLGDPRKPGFLKGLRPGHRAVALEQLAQAAASWHLQSGRNVDGTRNPTVPEVTTVIAQAGTIVSMPTAGKAATADALRLAATQAGARRGELLAEAAVAQREADAAASTRRSRPARQGAPGALRGKVAAVMGDDLPAPDMLYKADGLRARAAEYQRLAATPGLAPDDVAALVQAAADLEQQVQG